jgi:TonB-linked SusC/RagA family outer membrane protein
MKELLPIIQVFSKKIKLLPLLLLLLLSMPLYAQEITISGVVSSGGDNSSIPGVNVVIKGSLSGTVTDSQGGYSLKVPTPETILIFSFVGYSTVERTAGNQSILNVVLEPESKQLQEIVITALGVEREKKELGYAVQQVEGAQLEKAKEPNLLSSLTGRVAGLTIQNATGLFQDPQIQLRGAKPLIVIDGIPNPDADLWEVSSDDIESINVLKGATASALYGSIGRDGAIMITTKRGAMERTQVQVNSSTLFQPGYIRIPEVQSVYGNGNNGRYAYINGSGSGPEGAGWIWGPRLDQPDPTTPSGYVEVPQYNSPVDPVTGELVPLPFISRGKNNVRNFFQTGLITNNNVSVTGGNENGNFRVSASHMYQKGLVPNTDLNISTFGVSGGYKFTDKLRADASLTYNKQYTNNFPETGYGPPNYLYNLVLWTGTDIDVRDLRNYWLEGEEGTQQRHYNLSWYNNPYFQAYELLRGYNKDNTYGQITLTYNVLPNLDILVRSGINMYALDRSYKEPKSYIRYDKKSIGDFYLTSTNNFNMNTDFIMSYKQPVSENFAIKASFGGANRFSNFRTQSVNTDGLVVPGFYNLSNSVNALTGSNRSEEEKVNSLYATVDFEILQSLYVGVTGRNDWVSTLPLQNNSFFYPSVSFAGVISDLVNLPKPISFLKLRSSWSRVSNGTISETDPYSHVEAYNAGVNWNNNPSLYFPGNRLNPNISPETSDSWELGIDVRFLENRIRLDATYFSILDFNNITTVPVSQASGYSSRLENGNEFIRKGAEVMLYVTPLKKSDFSWDVNVNWSLYRRTLKSIFGDAQRLNFLRAGERTDAIYTSVWARSPQGEVIHGANGFPLKDPISRKVGHSDPNWIYGIQNTFRYKNVSLSFLFDGRVGGKLYSTTIQKMYWGGTHPNTVNPDRERANAGEASYLSPGVVQTGGSVEYDVNGDIVSDTRTFTPNEQQINYISFAKSYYSGDVEEQGYYDATFMKLREVTLTYNLPEKWLNKTFVKNASLSFIGRNLLLWSTIDHIDPDPGADNLQTPSARNIGFNVNLTF